MADEKKYIYGLGRRKQAVARVQLHPGGTGKVTVNGKDAEKYFPGFELPNMLKVPFTTIGMEGKFDVIASADGGGLRGQADAVRLGISRALLEFNPEFRASLKKQGFLKRDARVRERKKYGKKGARRSPQWAKR